MKKKYKGAESGSEKKSKTRHKPLFEGEMPLDHARKEKKERIKSLRKVSKKKANALVDKLEKCRPKSRCKSPACAICNWFTRRRHVRQMRRIFKNSVKEFHVTIVPIGSYFKPRALRQINTKRLISTLRKRMERAGLEGAQVVGGIEAEYKFKRKKMCLHWHLIFGNCTKKDVEKLRRYYPKDRQMKNNPIKPGDENHTYQYGIKNSTFGKNAFRKPKRPAPHIHAEHMYFLDRHTFRELMFMRGVRFNGNKLGVIDKSVMKRKPKDKKRSCKKAV